MARHLLAAVIGAVAGRRELLAERERLRIARDVHDSLGHRLSLVSVQAAALEVTDGLPPEQRDAVERLAGSARGAMDELYELVGALRAGGAALPAGATAPSSPPRGVEEIPALVAHAHASGLPVTLRVRGAARPVPADRAEAAYRVVEEGLTNAAKHAPGRTTAVDVAWEPDALLVTVVNPSTPGAAGKATAGHGLRGLDEWVSLAGGFLDHRFHDGRFRLAAMLPATAPAAAGGRRLGRARLLAVAAAIVVLVFGLLQVGMVTGGPA